MTRISSTRSLKTPTQAVILAGGRGTRMRPLTDTRPKSMIEFHGKPFMEYLVDLLREQGFEHILLLLGYLPEVIRDYFGDGRRWGVKIEYSVSGADTLTSRRVQLVRDRLDPFFLLMYCDNYWPMQMEKMWGRFVENNVPAMITVYSNKDKFSRDSVIVGDDGFVRVIDRSRRTPGLNGVEISFAILAREVLDLLPQEEMLIEDALYPKLAEQRQLLAYVTEHRYYSVGSLERLPITETFFARRPTVILDRDGVLNTKPSQAQYVRSWGEFQWLPGAIEALRLLKQGGFRVIVVSNQAGIARGALSASDLANIHDCMKSDITRAGGHIDAIYYCPHDWNDGCDCRKPRPGMLFQAQRDFHLDLSRTVFIGDDERDGKAADAAGCPFMMITDDCSLLSCVRQLLSTNSSQGLQGSSGLAGNKPRRSAECPSAY